MVLKHQKALSEALLKHKDTIVEINFSDLYTGRLNTEIPQSLEYLLPALLKLPNLKLINLSDNAFGLQTIDPIEAYLAQSCFHRAFDFVKQWYGSICWVKNWRIFLS